LSPKLSGLLKKKQSGFALRGLLVAPDFEVGSDILKNIVVPTMADLAFDPDGRTIYVITDSSGFAQNIEGGATTELWTPGSLIAFTYEGGGNASTTGQ
jgi:hypothetical protein